MKALHILSILVVTLFLFDCSSNSTEQTTKITKLDVKHGPSEEFFLQRMDPNGNFSLKAYTQGLYQAKEQSLLSSRSINGFDNEWTVQGPGNIGGRVNCIEVDPNDEETIYAGFAKGGIFKTNDGGKNWNPIFDEQVFSAIGDVTLDPQNSNVVYVGTGDPNISGYPSIGDGLYKSEDAGNTWTHLGLTDQRIISKVVVDHSDSQRIFAATMGLPFERSDDRGLYRSEDGGENWEQVLFLSDSTGVIDLLINPQQPNIMYAAGWDRIRNNFESLISGQGAKIFKSIDGGDTWNVLEGGLPNAINNGRIGIAICEASPNVLYAQYANPQSRLEAIYRSDNHGENWYPIPIDPYTNFLGANPLGGFAWYFGKIRVSPTNPDDIYLLGVDLWRSTSAGQIWNLASPEWWTYEVHADKHDLIYLADESILLGTDGGLYKGDKENLVWSDIENIPTNQFYRTAYNPHQPELYYGGAQDNGSTGGNEESINEWSRIFGGDGFQMAFDPVNPDRFFAETQRGGIGVTLDGGASFNDATEGIDFDEAPNWDMPYIISTHDENKLITGTKRLYVSEGDVPLWSPISSDLTDGPDGQTRNGNITAIHESPIQEDMIIAGTGDGNIWYGNLNDSTSFVRISDSLPNQYVTDVVASDTEPNRLFACHSGYRDNDNTAMIFRSEDLGQTWESIDANLPEVAINEMLILPFTGDSIIFIGTDAGVYGTVDAAQTWERLGTNMTIIPVYDLVWNEGNNELVAATFGRSILSYDLDPIIESDMSVATTPAKEETIERVKVYPTISTDEITIEYFNIEPDKNSSIAIVSTSGQLVQIIDNITDRKVEKSIDISDLPSGQYFAKIKVRHSIKSVGFIKI